MSSTRMAFIHACARMNAVKISNAIDEFGGIKTPRPEFFNRYIIIETETTEFLMSPVSRDGRRHVAYYIKERNQS